MINLNAQLTQLETAQLVRRYPEEEPTYIFKHALTQDAAYQSLLQKQRRAIHSRVVQVYEELYADRLDEFAAMLARHAMEAGDDAKALAYAMQAGNAAARIYANAEAIEHYTQAIHIAQRVEALHASDATLQNLYLKRGRVYELSDRFEAALENYNDMESLAREHGDRAMELAALIARATIYSIPSTQFDMPRSKALCEQALTLARAIGDQPSEAKILWNLLLVNSRLDTNYRLAIDYGEQAIAIARALNLQEQLAYLLNDISLLYVWEGDPERGTQCNLQAREMWRAMNNQPMLADNLNYAIMQHITLGEYDQAIQVSSESLEISQRIGNEWGEAFNHSWIGEAYLELGHIDQAIAVMENSIRLGEHSFQAPLAFTRADLAALYGDLGRVAHGIELAQLALNVGEKISQVMHLYASAKLAHLHLLNGDIESAQTAVNVARGGIGSTDSFSLFGMAMYETEAELGLAQGDFGRTIQPCDQLINLLRSRRMKKHLPEALYLKGIALYRQKKLDEAMTWLSEARSEAEATNSRWVLWRILSALAEIEMQRDHIDQARQLRTHAREIIEYIAAHTPLGLRESFLNLPDIRKVMELP
jgi:tetratricopeptide (TPR) repeat protein